MIKTNEKEWIFISTLKKLNYIRIQNDKILVIFKQNGNDSEIIECCCALRTQLKNFLVVQIEKLAFRFCNFAMLQ